MHDNTGTNRNALSTGPRRYLNGLTYPTFPNPAGATTNQAVNKVRGKIAHS